MDSMDRLFSILLFIAMGICIFSLTKFISCNQQVYVALSAFGITLSAGMLLFSNKKYLNKFKK
ncbi:MAG: hypothetical protein ACRC92_06245 [Peptostreptococcaceae bacterium]